jgi:hypothetical protein
MKDPIVEKLHKIRRSHAAKFNFDVEAIARDAMKIEPWMEKKIYARRHGKLVPVYPDKAKSRAAATRKP